MVQILRGIQIMAVLILMYYLAFVSFVIGITIIINCLLTRRENRRFEEMLEEHDESNISRH